MVLSIETIDTEVKKQLKERRLAALKAQWYEMYLNKVAYEANNQADYAKATQDRMDEIQTSYDAIAAIPEV